MTIHEFDKSLAASHAYADEPWWPEVYEAAFPRYQMQDMRADGWWQRAGIDRILNLPNGTQVRVDEKVRGPEVLGGDFALEVCSEWYGAGDPRNKPGWVALPVACDYLAYAFVRLRRCYLLPMRELQRTWVQHKNEWWRRALEDERQYAESGRHGEFRFADAKNRGRYGKPYVTRCVCVPVPVVLDAIRGCMVFEWDEPPAKAAS